MLQKFIYFLEYEKRFSSHTIRAYEKDLKQFFEYEKLNTSNDIINVTHFQVREWLTHLINSNLTKRSANRKLATLRSFYKWLRNEGLIVQNPLARVKSPKVEKRLPVFAKESELSLESLDALFDQNFSGIRDRLMFELFYQTGVRLSELIHLKESDITSDYIKVLGKRNKERLIPISSDLFQSISTFIQIKSAKGFKIEYLLILDNGKKLYPTFVYRKINHYLSLATNMDRKSPHVLRHTFATHMLNRGSGLETLKDLLGHANLSATQIYTHNSFAQLTSIYSQAHPRGRK